jgi:RNA polymerase sigma-70 factor, ECF subfamily
LFRQRFPFDRDYIDRLAAGDPEIEQHFTRYFGELLSIKLRSRLRSAALVEEVIQETFLRLLASVRQKKAIDVPGGVGAFVNAVCNHVLFETYRVQSRTSSLDEDTAADLQNLRIDSETRLASQEERAHVRSILALLPDKEREVLRWLFFEERDKDEICRLLGVDRSTLRGLLHGARQRFRAEPVRE